jgi:hypothetical protein
MKNQSLPILIIFALFFFYILSSNLAEAGGTSGSVGVLNVGDTFKEVRIEHKNNEERLYLTISDYNSHADIYRVKIILEYYGKETAVFTYKQFADPASFAPINTFGEDSIEGDLLRKEACTYLLSSEKETVAQKCDLKLLFVFRTTWFTHLQIIAEDRAGLTATTFIDYNTEEMMRSSNMIIIPGVDEPIFVGISSFVINLLAIVVGAAGAVYLAKKINLIGSAE